MRLLLNIFVALIIGSLAQCPSGFTKLVNAPNLDAVLSYIQQAESATSLKAYYFSDIDETLVLPACPFIYGLPRTDDFVSKIVNCSTDENNLISAQMESLYYGAPIFTVEPNTLSVINSIRNEHTVLPLTSRTQSDVNTPTLLNSMAKIGFRFSNPIYLGLLNGSNAIVANDSRMGGVIFGNAGESANKGDIIAAYLKNINPQLTNFLAILVDNSLSKCTAALNAMKTKYPNICFLSIHYTFAYDYGGQIDDMKQFLSDIKAKVNITNSQRCVYAP
eukprot:NODE_6625_length_862_cov_54.510149_g6028_i0.p1 GENE.NODE_6625_length_862_cov_54.510149_g6028_i0~~NODE_6625_length_862_cov_54.510149_g6028_i0.p1  ORF type:complete len:276 (-),score=26.06 NODE_6625_length_862_cov_54.510149_g6028_i0:6-833(-)